MRYILLELKSVIGQGVGAFILEPAMDPVRFQTHPEDYKHWRLEVDGSAARVTMKVEAKHSLRKDYELKLNSYDLGVDIELADLLMRLRFEHPGVRAVLLTADNEKVFSAGANIMMLRGSEHHFKVNFCKFTNETRFNIEDLQLHQDQHWICGVRGVCAGGGYELAAACNEIILADDGNSAVSLPEVELLGVLPGTGGLTRVVDKRKVRRDHADIFSTIGVKGVKGKRAVQWRLVDKTIPLSKYKDHLEQRLSEAAGESSGLNGIELNPIEMEQTAAGLRMEYVDLKVGDTAGQVSDSEKSSRCATLTIRAPEECPADAAAALDLGDRWWALKAFRELELAIFHLRFNYNQVGTIIVTTEGDAKVMLATDELLASGGNWFVDRVRHYMSRVLSRVDLTARSFYALIEPGSCFAGSLLELALAADRSFMMDDEDGENAVWLSPMNGGPLPMANGLTRIASRFLANPEEGEALLARGGNFDAVGAEEAGLVTYALDDIDWEDEVPLEIEARASMSPDALTGMEANLRFCGPETIETKVYGRLSAWQNWIFQRPNAVGQTGALQSYGEPTTPKFNWTRT